MKKAKKYKNESKKIPQVGKSPKKFATWPQFGVIIVFAMDCPDTHDCETLEGAINFLQGSRTLCDELEFHLWAKFRSAKSRGLPVEVRVAIDCARAALLQVERGEIGVPKAAAVMMELVNAVNDCLGPVPKIE